MKPLRKYAIKPCTAPSEKRKTPLHKLSPRQRKKAQKAERRSKLQFIIDDPLAKNSPMPGYTMAMDRAYQGLD